MLRFTQKYLAHRPAFFALIRPVEALLMSKHEKYLQDPVLDYGCGDGFFADLVFADQRIAVGLDMTQSRINQARDKTVYQQLEAYSGQTIPFADNSFSSVISNSVLEHVPDLNRALTEIARILEPNGYFLTTVMTSNWDRYLLGGKVCQRLLGRFNPDWGQVYQRWWRSKQEHHQLLTARQWRDRFSQAGLTVIEEVGYLRPGTVAKMELLHYLSLPSLLSYRLIGKWVLWSNWYQWFKFDQLLTNLNYSSWTKPNSAASLFYVLRRNKK